MNVGRDSEIPTNIPIMNAVNIRMETVCRSMLMANLLVDIP